jgi:peptide/nickel transport system substrate-binding protein
MRRRTIRLTAAAMGLLLFAGACGGDDSDSGADSGGGGATTTAAPKTPVAGGSLTMTMFSETRALDPVDSSGSGTAGGTELLALYDTILRWNPDNGKFENRTAESLTANSTNTEWTLKLKPGIKFRDGTDYNAEAVKLSIDRHKQSPINASRTHLTPVTAATVVDPLTVKFTLSQPWSGFPYVLADEPGMLVSPTALKALGDPTAPDYRDKKAAFNLKPTGAGAGPFEIVSFVPKEGIVMKKNPTYYGGQVYLDELKFITQSGAQQALESLKTGTVQVAFLRNPVVNDQAKKDKFPGYSAIIQSGEMLLVNNGLSVNCAGGKPEPTCVGKPDGPAAVPTATSNLKVRQAVAAAVDPNVINARAYDGKGNASSALFQKSFPFDPAVPGPKYDLDQAKKLLAEAKAAGYDGKIRVLCTNAPERQTTATAVGSMLQAAGFEVTTKADIDVATQIGEIATKRDFDLACWGYNVTGDEGGVLALYQNLLSTAGASNRVGFKSTEFDAALNEGLAASTTEAKRAAYKKMAEIYAAQVASLPILAVEEYVAWNPKVQGVYANQATLIYFDKAWIEK